MLVIFFAVSCGITIATFKPQSPPTVPNPVNVFEAVMADKCDYVLIAPAFIEVNIKSFPVI